MTTSSGLPWSSRLTFLMATVGCAVGLGNIWRFHYSAGVNGGGAFVLVYIGAVILLVLPVLMVALSFNMLSDVHPLGAKSVFGDKTFFDLFDYFVTNILMPLGGLLIAVFAGWFMKRKFSADELFGGETTIVYRSWLLLVRFFAPLILAYVFIDMATS